MTVTIYHNPRCSKSRATLALLEEKGITPKIVLYLEEPPTKKKLKEIIGALGIAPRELLRSSEAAYKELKLSDKSLSDSALIEAMVSHPKLIERPIVITDKGARIGRPPETVLEVL